MKNLFAKLLAIQKDIKPIVKDETNPHFHNSYFDINSLVAELKPILNKHGVVVIQPVTLMDDKPVIQTMVIDTESGEHLDFHMPLLNIEDPQKIGGMLTYFRRYALTSLFLLEAEDNDGEGTSAPKTQPRAPQAVTGGTHTCVDCKKPFTPKAGTEAYAKTCYPCYKAKADKPLPKLDPKENAAEDNYEDMGLVPF